MTRPANFGLLSMAKLATLLGPEWSTKMARELMLGMGLGKKRNGRFYVTRTQIRAKDPDMAIEIEMAAAERG